MGRRNFLGVNFDCFSTVFRGLIMISKAKRWEMRGFTHAYQPVYILLSLFLLVSVVNCGFLKEVQRDFEVMLESQSRMIQGEVAQVIGSEVDEIASTLEERISERIEDEAQQISDDLQERIGVVLASQASKIRKDIDKVKKVLDSTNSILEILDASFGMEVDDLQKRIQSVKQKIEKTESKIDRILSDPRVQMLSVAVQELGKAMAKKSMESKRKDLRFYLGFFLWILGGILYGLSKVFRKDKEGI